MKMTKTATMPAVPNGPAMVPAFSLRMSSGVGSGGTMVTAIGGPGADAPARVAMGCEVGAAAGAFGGGTPAGGGGETCKACVVRAG